MASYNGKSAGTINQAMKQYLPETDGCRYADFPLHRARWLRPDERTPDDATSCFIATGPELPDQGVRRGYVWGGRGPAGAGYYHLTTHVAHQLLYRRITRRRVETGTPEPGFCSCCLGDDVDPRQKMPKGVKRDDIDDLRLLYHARSVATVPDDIQAGKDALAQAQKTAQNHYHFDQNIQLAQHIVR